MSRRDEKRREREMKQAYEDSLIWEKQSRCPHLECDAESFHFDGRIQEVKCRECGATNVIDHDA